MARQGVKKLSVREKKVLLALQDLARKADVVEVERRAGLDHSAVMRAALNLKEMGLIRISERSWQEVSPTDEGRLYASKGLPERRLLTVLSKTAPVSVDEVREHQGLQKELANLALGWSRRKGWIEFAREKGETIITLTKSGEEALKRKAPEEQLLEKLARADSLSVDELSPDLRGAVAVLKGRKLLVVREKVRRSLELTPDGEKVLEAGVELEEGVSQLSHELLVSGKWREVKFRPYDVTVPGVRIYPGKVHPQQQVIDELREILLEMGFKEIKGSLVESEFWNFDALFQPQDHPAREIHDSLSLSKPARARVPQDLLDRVTRAHERGVAGSSGWRYKFNPEISRRTIMCSQTTAATVRYLAKRPKPPVKVFCIERVYRHEKIDYKHLAEFYQCEGIVMDRGLTLRDMLGYLKQIVVKLGLPKIRFRPGMFPFTEPSVEADVYHEEMREWIEILGAGLFRPEVLRPLGIRHPVLAWGIGLTRLIAIRLGLKDIRDIFCNDLNWISRFVYPPLSTKQG
ncbi:MAG: phenylalanine--tRNA ligase subunit alpha [Hadesarchaea archaeon]|nr:phenylalanine--tRNA ligase subunit alpha [Hadesarchaea archaeon]